MLGDGLACLALDRLLRVAEIGILGGGIGSSGCFTLVLSPSPGAVMLLLEFPRFQDRLSFRRMELIEEGVCGSSGVGSGGGDLDVVDSASLGARGPAGF